MISGMEHLYHEERLRVGTVQPGDEKALGTPYSSLPVPEGGLIRKIGTGFLAGPVAIGQGVMVLKRG